MNSTWSRKACSSEFCVGNGWNMLKWIHDDSDWCLTNRLIEYCWFIDLDDVFDQLVFPPIHCDQQDGLSKKIAMYSGWRALFLVPFYTHGCCGGHPSYDYLINTSLQYFSDYECISMSCFSCSVSMLVHDWLALAFFWLHHGLQPFPAINNKFPTKNNQDPPRKKTDWRTSFSTNVSPIFVANQKYRTLWPGKNQWPSTRLWICFSLCWHLEGHRNVGIFDTFLRVLIHKSTPQMDGKVDRGGWSHNLFNYNKMGPFLTGELSLAGLCFGDD